MKWVRDTEYPISNDIMDPDSLQNVSLYTLFPLLTSRYIREQQDVDLNEIPLRSSSRESVKPIRYVEDLPIIKPSKLSLRLSEVRKWMDSQCVGKKQTVDPSVVIAEYPYELSLSPSGTYAVVTSPRTLFVLSVG